MKLNFSYHVFFYHVLQIVVLGANHSGASGWFACNEAMFGLSQVLLLVF